MSDSMVKMRTNKMSDSYAAKKSQNEIYYQMASIFKQISNVQEKTADKILSRLLSSKIQDISLVN
ncbi:MAG: hypothetical protein L3J69_08080 [Desulfobacula sp.]|nr:hypothetical protein [Desulfobacula sp.]